MDADLQHPSEPPRTVFFRSTPGVSRRHARSRTISAVAFRRHRDRRRARGVEAAWAAANLLAGRERGRRGEGGAPPRPRPSPSSRSTPKIGVMSRNPAIGGLARGRRPRDRRDGRRHGPRRRRLRHPVQGPQHLQGPGGAARALCDKHAYAARGARLIASRPDIAVIGGRSSASSSKAARSRASSSRVQRATASPSPRPLSCSPPARSCGLMHTGESQTPGGRSR